MAGWTGLEPAAFRVTGGRYNQLNYHPANRDQIYNDLTDTNQPYFKEAEHRCHQHPEDLS